MEEFLARRRKKQMWVDSEFSDYINQFRSKVSNDLGIESISTPSATKILTRVLKEKNINNQNIQIMKEKQGRKKATMKFELKV